MKIDFGCGYNPKDGYQTCDITGYPQLDYFYDSNQNKIIGLEDNTVEEIHCRNVIHHIKDLKKLFIEFKRVLMPNGTIVIIEANRESYETNVFLDKLWYRSIIPRMDIWFSETYRDFIKYIPRGLKVTSNEIVDEKQIVKISK